MAKSKNPLSTPAELPALFADPATWALSNAHLATLAWQYWKPIILARNVDLLGATYDEIDDAVRDVIAVAAVLQSHDEVSKVSLAGEEKILRAIARGELDHAGQMIRDLFFADVKMGRETIRFRQKKSARQKRSDPLDVLIEQVVAGDRGIAVGALMAELSEKKGGGVIIAVTGDRVLWRNKHGKPKPTGFHALESRLTRARKRLTLTG